MCVRFVFSRRSLENFDLVKWSAINKNDIVSHLSNVIKYNAAILSCKTFQNCWIKSNKKLLKYMEYLKVVFKTLERQLLDMRMIPKLHSVHKTYFKKFEALYLFKLAQCVKVLPFKRHRLPGTRAMHKCNSQYISELFIPKLVQHAESLINKYFNSTSYSPMDDDSLDSLSTLNWIFVHFARYVPTIMASIIPSIQYLERLAQQCKLVHMFDQMIHHNRLIFKYEQILSWFAEFYRMSKHLFKQERLVIFQAMVAMSYLNYLLEDVLSPKNCKCDCSSFTYCCHGIDSISKRRFIGTCTNHDHKTMKPFHFVLGIP